MHSTSGLIECHMQKAIRMYIHKYTHVVRDTGESEVYYTHIYSVTQGYLDTGTGSQWQPFSFSTPLAGSDTRGPLEITRFTPVFTLAHIMSLIYVTCVYKNIT